MPSPTIKAVVEPPVYDPPITEYATGQQHSTAWTEYYQTLTDKVNELVNRANVLPTGVTDGSEAETGSVGEYLTASGSVGLANNTANVAASLTLTAGDWDVAGNVTFHISGAASNHYAAGVDAFSTEIIATIPSGTGTWRLPAVTVRRNVTADTAVSLVALAGFSSGSVSADGTIWARRMR